MRTAFLSCHFSNQTASWSGRPGMAASAAAMWCRGHETSQIHRKGHRPPCNPRLTSEASRSRPQPFPSRSRGLAGKQTIVDSAADAYTTAPKYMCQGWAVHSPGAVCRAFHRRLLNAFPRASQALSRFTVLDLTRVRSGPTCVRQLADWGANVIKIDALTGGRRRRAAGRPAPGLGFPEFAPQQAGDDAQPEGPEGPRGVQAAGRARPTWWSRISVPT